MDLEVLCEKLYKKHPFVYCIDDTYYVLGWASCKKSRKGELGCISKYLQYRQYVVGETGLSDIDMACLIKSIFSYLEDDRFRIADKSLVGFKEEFKKLSYGENELKEIEAQINQLEDNCRACKISNYLI